MVWNNVCHSLRLLPHRDTISTTSWCRGFFVMRVYKSSGWIGHLIRSVYRNVTDYLWRHEKSCPLSNVGSVNLKSPGAWEGQYNPKSLVTSSISKTIYNLLWYAMKSTVKVMTRCSFRIHAGSSLNLSSAGRPEFDPHRPSRCPCT